MAEPTADYDALVLAVGRAACEARDDISYERDDYSDEYEWRVVGKAALDIFAGRVFPPGTGDTDD